MNRNMHRGSGSSLVSYLSDTVKGSLKAINDLGLSNEVKMQHHHQQEEASLPILEPIQEEPRPSGWTPLLFLTGVIAALGACFPLGYNFGVLNAPQKILRSFCQESIFLRYSVSLPESSLDLVWASVVSVLLIGGIIGSIAAGHLADKYGRKRTLLICLVLGLFGATLYSICHWAMSVEMLLIGRFISGLSGGLATSLVPMYLTEISPTHLRGSMGVLCPAGMNLGLLTSQILGLTYILGTESCWPYLLTTYTFLSLVCLLVYPILPESPKYLFVIKDDEKTAVSELCRLRNRNKLELEAELKEMRKEKKQQENKETEESWGIWRILKERNLRMPLALVCALQAGQQLSGINAVFYYAVPVFERAGLSVDESQLANIGAGFINMSMSFIAIPVIAKCGRKPLVVVSCFLSIGCMLMLTGAIYYIDQVSWMAYASIALVLLFVFGYGIGLGPVPFFIGSELFPVGPRPVAMAYGSMFNWLGNFIVGMTFPSINRAIGCLSFSVFVLVLLLLTFFIINFLPESKGLSPEEIIFSMASAGGHRIYDVTPNRTQTNDDDYYPETQVKTHTRGSLQEGKDLSDINQNNFV